MNAHKTLGLLAAVLVTAGQALVFAADTHSVAQSSGAAAEYASPADSTAGANPVVYAPSQSRTPV